MNQSNLFNRRQRTNTMNLSDLVNWLEYGAVSGYPAARASKEQEKYWAKQLRELL